MSHLEPAKDASMQTAPPIVLVGNPNVGKSVIFGELTGSYVTVANYPGTTVEVARGTTRRLPGHPRVLDTPGTNSLTPQSEDEQVTRDLLLAEPDALVVQVGDTKNLRRVLYLTLQLAELGRRQVLVLNLQDEAQALGVSIDAGALEATLGVPVIPTVAIEGHGLPDIPRTLPRAAVARLVPKYPQRIEDALRRAVELLPPGLGGARRGITLMLLGGDRSMEEWLSTHLDETAIDALDALRADLERALGARAGPAIARGRHRMVDEVVRRVTAIQPSLTNRWLDRLGALTMHRCWGVPILLVVLAAAYGFVGVLGAGTLVGWIERGLFGRVINPAASALVAITVPWAWLRDLLVGQYGLITMALTYALAIVLPVVGTFFVFFSVLEDTGYLPRLAIMVNRVFRVMGLNGKAVLPMVLGLGCDTMATLTTRILPTRKERVLVTLLLALGVPCSAQLAVVLAILSSLSPLGTLIWAVVVLATLFGVGWAASRVLPGRTSDFILEIPPLRLPKLSNIVTKTLARTEWYLKEAVPLFIVGTLLLYVLDRTGALTALETAARPVVVGALDLPAQAADAFLVGFLRRDYGAAGFFALRQHGLLDGTQSVVALIVVTLFVPCIANFLVAVKERGLATALAIGAFIVPFAFSVGALINWVLRASGITL